MNNFGVIEVAGAKKTNAPGWAYVPDTGPAPGSSALQPANRKRAARNQAALSSSDLSVRQDAKIRKELDALDRDGSRDASIPVPPKPGRAQNKHTPNVRKILQSQKTFANHLDDYRALLALAETNPAAAAALNAAQLKPGAASAPTPPATAAAKNSPAPTPPPPTQAPTSTASKRSAAAAKRAAAAAAREAKEAAAREAAAAEAAAAEAAKAAEAEQLDIAKDKDDDVEMTDAPGEASTTETAQTTDGSTTTTSAAPAPGDAEPPLPPPPQTYPPDGTILPAYRRAPPAAHPSDDDPLLMSHVPYFPTDDELRALMTAPPLSYLDARAAVDDDDGDGYDASSGQPTYPTRHFCEVCGYWGRVRCTKCGSRVCALQCLTAHREECFTRYGV
ncbi:hypothetical protein B0T26DRAFT_684508 [Lasiosphaeria miniovina]|uniref:HIT-type domain-containing protein n=1 Tax=Lasiosphaeria miniovina TaxID=1954250 RepID=A0AA40BFU1_9PEZI|nr:uncharacterized protein B0T26DRAFT_684508 [Lasiosphaeria miniovina]KAK0733468.1 hypothetical protein B0T26DRAFT_684508 [Lasiosphaeria miniovina]